MRGSPTHSLVAVLAISLASVPAALARPAATTSAAPAAPHAKRSARSAVPARHYQRPQKLVRSRHQADLTPLERMAEDIRKVWSGRTLRRGTTAVYIVDAKSGDVLYAVNEDTPLNPASNVKLISTATVLATLGAEWRYATRLFGPVPDADGVAHGDLYLRGSYDPTLSSAHLRGIARRLAASGVRRVSGDLLLGPGARRDGVGISRIQVRVTGTSPGQPPEVTLSPALDFVDLEVTAVTSKRRRARPHVSAERVQPEIADAQATAGPRPEWVDGDVPPEVDAVASADHAATEGDTGAATPEDRLRVTVSGKIGAGRTRIYKRWVPQRAELTAEVLRAALRDAGVEVEGSIRRVTFDDYVHAALHASKPYLPVELARHDSAPIRDLVTRVNKRSINWLADSLVKTAGAVTYGGDPDLGKGVHAMVSWLQRAAGIDSASVTLDTGSGLSYKTALTARHIVRVLRTAAGFTRDHAALGSSPLTDVFRHSLSIAGRDGTLRRRFRKSGVRGKLIGKTGTLTGIIALSGVLTAEDGSAICFSIVTNHHRRGYRRRVKREHEAMVKAMYRYLETREPTATASR